jgi:hypothetical protein
MKKTTEKQQKELIFQRNETKELLFLTILFKKRNNGTNQKI